MKYSDIPKTRQVLGTTITIKVIDFTKEDQDSTTHGDCNSFNRVIRLHSKLNGESLKRAYKHELAHMYLDLSGLSQLFTSEQEEAICTLMENFEV